MRKIIGMIGAHGNVKGTKHYIAIDIPMELKYDLRLGNQVQQGQIIQLEPEWNIVKPSPNFHETKGFNYWGIEPIKLTEASIIHGLGFEKATDQFEGYLSPKSTKSMMRIRRNEEGGYIHSSSGMDIQLDYVHELQNLYQEIFKKRLIWL